MKISLPKTWQKKTLEELFEFVTGGDWGKDESFTDPDYTLAYCIRGSEIKKWDDEKGKTASLRMIKKSSVTTRKLKEGDILVEISGGGPEQPVGRTVLVDKTVLSYKPLIPKICTNFLRLVRPVKDINSKYLNLFLKLFYYSGEITKYQGGSNNLRNLKFPDFIKIEVPLAPLPEQNRIVTKIEELFSDLDNGIANLKTVQQQLKTYRQAVLKYAFEGRFTESWRKTKTSKTNAEELLKNIFEEREKKANALGKKIKVVETLTLDQLSQLQELPKSWKWSKLNDISFLITDGTHLKPFYTDSGIPFLSVKNVRPGKIKDDEIRYIAKEQHEGYVKRCKPEYGDILYTKVGATYGYAAINKLSYEFSIYVSLCLIKYPQNLIDGKYLEYCINSNLIYKQAQDRIKGIGRPDLHLEEIRDFHLPICSIEEQRQVVQEIESRLSVCDIIEETITVSLQQSESLRQSILKKAFEGKLV